MDALWGLGYDWDPDWMLTERHKELRATLIELCQQEMRDNAKAKAELEAHRAARRTKEAGA